MRPIATPRRFMRRGFTLVELMVVLAIMAILLAIAVPSMRKWIYANQVTAATQFYTEGFAMARNQALTHNSASRIVLTNNANGQSNWRVDICFPRPATPCTDASTNWSTLTTRAPLDPEGDAGFKSAERRADKLPRASDLAPQILPAGANSVYFTPLGWVDRSIGTPITRIVLTPSATYAADVPRVAVALTMAGVATRCKPDASSPDVNRCPP